MQRNAEEAARTPSSQETSCRPTAGPGSLPESVLRKVANEAMDRYADGDEAAFRELYRLTAERLFCYLFRWTRNAARAEELKQQTFLHMHLARGSFRRGASVFPWMYAIAHRLAIDDARRAGREVSLETEEGRLAEEPVCAAGAADEQLIAGQLHDSIDRTLRRLPEKQRAAYELIQQEGLSYREAAEALGTTLSAVTSLLHRAHRALHRTRAGMEE